MNRGLVTPSKQQEKVGILLGIGILLLPIVFAWWLLRKGYSPLARGVSFAWLGVYVLANVGGFVGRPPDTRSANAQQPSTTVESPSVATSSQPALAEPPPSPAPLSLWTYETSKDEMRGTTSRFAATKSTNEIDFGFPYGKQHVQLLVRERPEDGLSVILTTEAQFMCSEYSSDVVAVKFDDGEIDHFGCSEPSSGTTGVLFIRNQKRFLKNLLEADQLIVEPEFFQRGRIQIKFATTGLEW